MRQVVDREVLGQLFLRILRLNPVRTIPSLLHTHLHLQVALTGGTSGRSLGALQNATLFWERGTLHRKNFSLFQSSISTPWLRRLFSVLSSQRLSFDPVLFHLICGGQCGIGVDLCPNTLGSPVVIPPVLHTFTRLNNVQADEAWEP